MNLKELYQAGISDVRVPPVVCLAASGDRTAAINSTGVISVIGLFQVNRMAAALTAIAVERVDFSSPQDRLIETGFSLAQPWDQEAMVRAIRQRRDDGTLDAVEALRVSMNDMPVLYLILSGDHAVFAARQFGDTYIKAQVVGELRCDPTVFYICDDRLMRFMDGGKLGPVSPAQPWGEAVPGQAAVLAPDIVQIAQALGVRIVAPNLKSGPVGNDNET